MKVFKKKYFIILIFTLLFVLILPIPKKLDNSGTIKYSAILYKIYKVNAINKEAPSGYDKGILVEILGKVLLNSIKIHTSEKDLKIDEIVSEDGLLFSIVRNNPKCNPVKLEVYNDGNYKLYTAIEACKAGQTCTMMLKYTKMKSGTYDYNVLDILNHSKNVETFATFYPYNYEITVGKDNKKYITANNEYLNEFLKNIEVNLNVCVKKDYVS